MHNDAPQSVGLLWTSDRLVAETSASQHNTYYRYPRSPVGFEPTTSAGQRLQTYALDRAATGIGIFLFYRVQYLSTNFFPEL